jgi:hypothetical protein
VKSWAEQGNKLDKIETILTDCFKEIKSGKASLADCLNRYPTRRRELEPLLKIALNIQGPPSFKLDSNDKQAAKTQLFRQIKRTRQKKYRSIADIFSFGLFPRIAWARVAMSCLVVLTLLSTLGGGTAYAAQSSLPGDLLYPVKTGVEDVRLLVAPDSPAKAELNLEFALTRLVEMSELATGKGGKAELAVEGYRRNLNAAGRQIMRISDAAALPGLLESALENLQDQVVLCDNIMEANPVYSAIVSEASTLAVSEQAALLEMLAQRNILRAAQINLDAMQNRLRRARVTANGDQYQIMQTVLLQYQQLNQLGEEILQIAQATNDHISEIENLSSTALTGYLAILDSILQQAPPEYRNNIDACRQMTLQFQTQAQYRYQRQGSSGTGPDGASPKNNGGSTAGQEGQNALGYQGGSGDTGSGTPNTTSPAPGSGGSHGSGTNSGGSGGAG